MKVRVAVLLTLGLLTEAVPIFCADPPAVSTAPVSAIPLEDVPMQVDSASASINAIESDLASDRTMGGIKKDLPVISQEINARSVETSKLLAASPSLDRLRRLEAGWNAYERDFNAWQHSITRRAEQFDKYQTEINQLKEIWNLTLADAQTPATPAPIQDSIRNVVQSIDGALTTLDKKRRENWVLQGELTREDSRVDREIEAVSRAYKEALDHLFNRDSPPLWKAAMESSGASAAARDGQSSLKTQVEGLRAYAERQAHKFFVHAMILLFLVLGLFWMRQHVRPKPASGGAVQTAGVYKVLEVPAASAVVLSLLASLWLYPQAPRLLWAIWGAAALVPAVVIMRRLIKPVIYPILYALIIFYAVDQVREVTAVLPLVSRLLFVAEMLAAAIVTGQRLKLFKGSQELRTDTLSRFVHVALQIALVFFSAAFLCDIMGFVNLATLLGNGVLHSAMAALILFSLIRIVEAMLAFVLTIGPGARLVVAQKHHEMIQSRARMLFTFAAWVSWGLYTLGLFVLRQPFFDLLNKIAGYPMTLGSFSITPGHIVSFGLTLWAAILVSRFARFVLDEDVYPRLHLSSGLPYAVSTLFHYVVLCIGFFLAVAALGFDMTKFTILAGAFGVGVGFGTQNIINNFVSGLILLFERPIKVGDVIQVTDATGTVQQIGIRATIIRTTSGSDVVIPNGSLISGQVTNWTSIRGERSVEIPVVVAAGADPAHVMNLLKSVAAADPRIGKDPAPQAFFEKYNPGSLEFKLLVWTTYVSEIPRVLSDLSLAINAALMKENLVPK